MRALKLFCLSFLLFLMLSTGLFASPLDAQQKGIGSAAASSSLTNDDIIGLAGAGLADDVIIAKIRTAPAISFDTSVAGLKALKAGGVSGALIKVMLDPTAPVVPPAPAASPMFAVPAATDPDDPNAPHVGLYVQVKGDDGKPHMTKLLTTMMSAIKGPGMGSMLATTYSFGLHKSKSKTVVAGAKAQIETTDPNPMFYDYAGDMNINNLTLVHFEVKGDSRMVTSFTTGVLLAFGNAKSGVGADEKEAFTAEQIRPGVYRLTLTKPLEPGAYAFGDMISGQLFSFHDFDILPPQ